MIFTQTLTHVFPQVKYKKIYFKIKIIYYGTYSTCTLFKLINFRILAKWADTETHTVVVIAKFAIMQLLFLAFNFLQYYGTSIFKCQTINKSESQPISRKNDQSYLYRTLLICTW